MPSRHFIFYKGGIDINTVCIDLDGTLLDDKKKISKRSINTLRTLIDNKIEVIIATGRHFYMVENFLKELDRDIMICSNNGAMSRLKNTKKLFNVEYLDKEIFFNILFTAEKLNLLPYVYVDFFTSGYHLLVKEGSVKKTHFEEKIPDKKMNEQLIRYINTENLQKSDILCLAFLDNEENILKLYEKFKDLDITKTIYTLKDGRFVLEFQSKKADKWIAIKRYLDYKNINTDKIVSFGDEINDLMMIKNSKMGFFMKNANENLKKHTKYITEYTNNQEGVSIELEKIFKDFF